MLVVGGVLAFMPMRTPLTPALPTAILLCSVAIAVDGSSIAMRSGEVSFSTFGVTVSRVPISVCTASPCRTTLTRSSLFEPAGEDEACAAEAATFGAAAGFTEVELAALAGTAGFTVAELAAWGVAGFAGGTAAGRTAGP